MKVLSMLLISTLLFSNNCVYFKMQSDKYKRQASIQNNNEMKSRLNQVAKQYENQYRNCLANKNYIGFRN